MRFTPPAGALGADLFWWRETGTLHTLVTIHSRSWDGLLDDVVLHCVLFGAHGAPQAAWDVAMRDRPFCVIDSARIDDWLPYAPHIASGVLAVYTLGTLRGGVADNDTYHRLYSMVDWYSDHDGLSGLHNDQSIVAGEDKPIDLTEIAALETTTSRNSLVFVNGDTAQAAGTLTVAMTNAGGASRSASYAQPMAPFTVHQVRLAELFPALDAFGDGRHLNVGGRFAGKGLYLRPYVITEGARLSAYHGGDVYQWAALPAIHYRLLGSGEVNPMAVMQRPDEIETTVNLFNSHGDLEESFWVDAELFDAAGVSVARREKWRCARRRALTRGDIRDLLPNPAVPFNGHIALTFSPTDAEFYPRHLQALLEYRSAGGAARVMAWSDEWNSRIKLHQRKREGALPLRSYYRAICGRGFSTWVSLTNAGHGGYRETVPCTITLCNATGMRREVTRELAPYATLFADVAELFDGAAEFLAPGGVGVIEVESTSDLANVQFVRHDATGAWAAEHYMAATTREGDRVAVPAGS